MIVFGLKAATLPERPPRPATRLLVTDQGVTQLPDEKMAWMLDAKLGMFIHWGLYSGPGRGEWVMENEGIRPENYRRFAFPDSKTEFFDAKDFRPAEWAALAKEAGMGWLCLTARHHDGFSLFDSPHPNAFTSQQTLGRDLIAEYTSAVRAAGLKVGLYYSPMSWRYPGYYEHEGTGMKPNKFKFPSDPANKENARLMKEENYVNVKKLLTAYGPIDHIFWDGGWLAQKGSDASAAHFHEPGLYLDPENPWPVPEQYWDIDETTGQPLGIMGMVRKYQPDAITNLRYGWVGDIHEEEGARETKGPIRDQTLYSKCMCIQRGPWGYHPPSLARTTMGVDELVAYLSNCAVRNMTLLLNVTPDRHGVIPEIQQTRLRELGAWLRRAGDAIYGTRGGPWQPVDGQYGYTYKQATVFACLLKDFKSDVFVVPPMGRHKVLRVYDVITKQSLPHTLSAEGAVTIRGFDRTTSPAATWLAVVYDRPIADVWLD